MVERFHRTLKAALMCHQTTSWAEVLPIVLLGLRTNFKLDIGASAAEMLYGQTLRLPGEIVSNPSNRNINQHDFITKLREQMQSVKSTLVSHHIDRGYHIQPALSSSTHAFIRNDKVKPPLTQPYDGPYQILERNDKTFRILIENKEQTVSIDRLKAAFICPDTDIDIHNKSMVYHTPNNVNGDQSVQPNTTANLIKSGRNLKAGKSAGPDNIAPELLKADKISAAQIIQPIVNNFWSQESLPPNLKDGIIINIPKKGNLMECSNWRGITLLNVAYKVIAQILHKRLTSAVEPTLRAEQAGFRHNRSCDDHINSLRIIVEQSSEWRSPLYLLFIDFKRSFDTLL
ncbi:uncharacterized protein LOC119677223 [Teleopsis dalmanni]|uniref:uncharacterized protein LOC119677223 n=1 Tax=Teleopsis dalmanni TaxID=139649 RepID=UPI0018CFAEAE|nr:uncharacterized protein LOC119677223 [Teleopsis dalmanni]